MTSKELTTLAKAFEDCSYYQRDSTTATTLLGVSNALTQAAAELANEEVCVWTWNERGCWNSACGNAVGYERTFRPSIAHKYCRGCGKRIEVNE